MAIQFPNYAPVGYALDYTDFLRTKVDRAGLGCLITGTVSVPSGATVGQIIGLFPFNKGFKLAYGSSFIFGAFGASVTLALGWYYNDSTVVSSNTAGYLAASATAAAGGVVVPNVLAGYTLDAAADGWVVAVIGGATTGSTAAITYNCIFNYDISGVTN
jgi:hypothetical protein